MFADRKGFTMIELMMVIVIIGIVAAISVPKLLHTKSKAQLAQMKSDLRNLVTAEERFFADSMKYTQDIASLKYSVSAAVNAPTISTGAGFWTATNTHRQLAGATCGIMMGTNTFPSIGMTNPPGEGEPGCHVP